MSRKTLFFAGLLVMCAAQAASVFNLFGPANGILKGSATTYQTSAAVNTDVTGLWTGSCTSSTYLRGDGACATPAGTTTSANPSATIGLSAVNGTAATFMTSDSAPPLSQGITPTWTGVHTFSNTVAMNGAVTFSSSMVGNSATGGAQGAGTINATGLFINGAAVGASPTGANPSASVGLSAVNGSAATFLRSDGAPALSQAINPTWTAQHVFTPGTAVSGILVNGAASSSVYPVRINGSSTSGQSNGLNIVAGTTSADRPFTITNQANTQNLWAVDGVGGMWSTGATGASKGVGTLNAQGLFVNGVAVGSGSGTGLNLTLIQQSGGASQVYTLPTGAFGVEAVCIGGGGGGGSAAHTTSGTAAGGGGGGGGGGISVGIFSAALLGSSVTITFSNTSTGGNGAAPVTAVANGASGTAGSNVSFGGFLLVSGGQPGTGSTGGASTGGNGGVGNIATGTVGGAGNTGAGNPGVAEVGNTFAATSSGTTGGGSGGGFTATPSANTGSAGGSGTVFITLTGGTAGTSAGGLGGTGAAGNITQPASGGGGGGSAIGATNGGNGGPGGTFGGGGGGGGASLSTSTQSGGGGQGGAAACYLLAW
jgi:hypothetical protein